MPQDEQATMTQSQQERLLRRLHAGQSVSIDAIARQVHEAWLRERPRAYSPYNQPWDMLPPEDRLQISRQVRMTVDYIRRNGYPTLTFVDEYMAPGPGDSRWQDPQG